MKFDVRGDVSGILQHLTASAQRHVPYATARALTKSAQFAGQKVTEEIVRDFDRPTEFTKKAVFIRPATKQNLTAEVKIKDDPLVKGKPAIFWLSHNIYGGSRPLKGSERLLQRAGKMPSGQFLVPTRNAPLDQYGNPSRGLFQKILSDCMAQRDPLANRGKRKRRKGAALPQTYFSTFPITQNTAKLKPGIWMRTSAFGGSSIRPVFLFSGKVRYRSRLPFDRVADGAAKARFPLEFALAMREALATAR